MKIHTEGKNWQNRIKVFIAYKLSRINSQIAQSLANLGGIAEYMLFVRRSFGAVAYQQAFTPKREFSWGEIVKRINPTDRVLFLEFGVAWGYATQEMFNKLESFGFKNTPNLDQALPGSYYHLGFDLFSGLPENFRQYPEGFFATHDGNPPNIEGANYVQGFVQKTLMPELAKIDINEFNRVIIFFDLDLYEPTKYAMVALQAFIKPGTFIYFDELFDFEERRVLMESFENLESVELVSYTPTSGTILIL